MLSEVEWEFSKALVFDVHFWKLIQGDQFEMETGIM
jgi:hypothetical protein